MTRFNLYEIEIYKSNAVNEWNHATQRSIWKSSTEFIYLRGGDQMVSIIKYKKMVCIHPHSKSNIESFYFGYLIG